MLRMDSNYGEEDKLLILIIHRLNLKTGESDASTLLPFTNAFNAMFKITIRCT